GYDQSVPVLRILAFTPLMVLFGNIVTVQCLLSLGLKKEYSRIYIATSLIGMAAMIVLIYFFSIEGAAFSVLSIEALVVALTIYRLRKNNINLFKQE
ncbi:MAG: hypothetical protein Q8942_19265, partial [Bacillota bacterium]|nr:hypothetical protein [Bacillota bacterium]